MAQRPWVTPEELREYTERQQVKDRSDDRLKVDIARAEQYVITYTHNDFARGDLPEPVKLAVLLLAEAYGWNAYVSAQALKSETFDDYSYTSGLTAVDFGDLGLAGLLDPFVLAGHRGSMTMRLRRL